MTAAYVVGPNAVPPNEHDAEAAVLSALMLEPERIAGVRQFLTPKHFYADRNRRIYEAILGITDAGSVADPITIKAWLRDCDRLQQVGGAEYIAIVSDATPAIANVVEHARLIVERALRRHLIEVCKLTAADAAAGSSVADLFARLTEQIARFTPTQNGTGILAAEKIFAPLSPPDYAVDHLSVRGSLTEIVAYGQSGKSWLGIDAVLSVATGEPFLGRFRTSQGRARLIDYEAGEYECRRRFQLGARARGIVSPVDALSLVSMPAVYLSSTTFPSEVERWMDGQALIVIDTLKAGSPGVDENNSEIRTGLDHIKRAAERAKCAAWVLVHAKKISNGKEGAIDPREAGRGSSAIFDAADVVLHVTYTEGQPLRVQQTKARGGRPVDPFLVEIADTADGGVSVRASDIPRTPALAGAEEFDRVCDIVLSAVKANPGASQALITAQVNRRSTTVKAALEKLERHGAVRNTGAGNAGRWFFRSREAES